MAASWCQHLCIRAAGVHDIAFASLSSQVLSMMMAFKVNASVGSCMHGTDMCRHMRAGRCRR